MTEIGLATSAFILAVHRAARRMLHGQFRPWLFNELGLHLRFDAGMWLRMVVDDDGPQMHDHFLDRQHPERVASYMEQRLWREDPLMSTAFAQGPTRAWAKSIGDVPLGRLRDHLEMHELRHVVCSFEFDPVARNFAGFAMFRRGRDDAFGEEERLLVEVVEPHLRDAWTHNWLREVGASRPDDLPTGFTRAVFTADHVLSAYDDHFTGMMRNEWPDWRGPYLPVEWVEHLACPPRAGWAGRNVVAYLQRLHGGPILLHLRASHALDRLSPRKREVALLFAAGASQSAIAERLRLSPSTVNNYLVEVYRVLGIGDKAELAVLVASLSPRHEARDRV